MSYDEGGAARPRFATGVYWLGRASRISLTGGHPIGTRAPALTPSTAKRHSPASTATQRLVRQIQEALSFDLLNKDMRSVVSPKEHFTKGHCYVASEAFHYLHGRKAGYEPRGRDYHWWLQHPRTGDIVDPTAPQLDGPFDYTRFASKRFMPQSPKRATKELMRRVRAIRRRPGHHW